jgi:crotonobetainyl-CoA:carnitine CoA-transferase CaiB-like acyl-CoA transferase
VTGAAGAEVLRRLLRDADVVTVNATGRQLERLGIDAAALEAAGDPVLCRLDAWGGPQPGPRSEHPGYDDLVQASTGIMARFGGSLATPEEHAHVGTIDVLAGYSGALGVALALLGRARGEGAREAHASLAAAGQLIQLPFMFDHPGRAPFDEPSGPTARGSGPLYRSYAARDGRLFLACRPDQLGALAAVEGLAGVDALAGAELEDELAARFATDDVERWAERCLRRDIAAQPIATLRDVRARNLLEEPGDPVDLANATFRFIRHRDHPSGHVVDLVAPNAIRPRDGAVVVPGAAPKYGAHTRAVLAELGYTPAEIDRLVADGVAADAWSDAYLPS